MTADFQVIGCDGVPSPTHCVLLLGFYCRIGAHYLTIGNRIGEETLLLLGVVHTQGGADCEVLERSNACMSIAEHTPLCIDVVLRVVNHAQWILTL